MSADGRAAAAEVVLETIRSRRVTRVFDGRPVPDDALLDVLEAGRWASSGGNRRIHRFLVIRDPGTIARLRAVSPGILGRPTAVIAICTDSERAAEELVQLDHDTTTWIDVGTAAMNMMIAAHAVGLGSCPVTSFSQGSVRVVLGLPTHVTPELLLVLGHPRALRRDSPVGSSRSGVDAGDRPALPPGLVSWERLGHDGPTR